ncbi:CAMK family protein kinase [Trichomonas vaginalis G3]|uniref:CAMK family protein kinase n=2 Tax=Trichomonas vaginalis (strain ATCC PRA-98 / G3) TaxID=412133 RepID=A2EGG0_TRIV3|nr:CAMK family protein kinase [Trichomonas vaginalis G3]|eukprot:XP_001320466.1 CAMK family protein kinase [Trichomonas vaginalis G3]
MPPIAPLVTLTCDDNTNRFQRKVNQYNLLKTIGQGANCKVVLIQDSLNRKYYAAKVFKLAKTYPNAKTSLPLEREVRIMKKIHHENIVNFREVLFAPEKNAFYLIMEWGNCGSLQNLIDTKIKIAEKTIASIFRQLVNGLSYLHSQGFVHQDIKPSNVLLFSDGTAKIGDFGIGHSFQSAETVVGTPAYQAPEIFDDSYDDLTDLPALDPAKEDVWSLGVTLFETLFGKLPFTGENVYEIARTIRKIGLVLPNNISGPLSDLLFGMLNPDPTKRLSLDEVKESSFFKDSSDRFVPPINPVEPPKPDNLLPIYQIAASVCDDTFSVASKKNLSISNSWDGLNEHYLISNK